MQSVVDYLIDMAEEARADGDIELARKYAVEALKRMWFGKQKPKN